MTTHRLLAYGHIHSAMTIHTSLWAAPTWTLMEMISTNIKGKKARILITGKCNYLKYSQYLFTLIPALHTEKKKKHWGKNPRLSEQSQLIYVGHNTFDLYWGNAYLLQYTNFTLINFNRCNYDVIKYLLWILMTFSQYFLALCSWLFKSMSWFPVTIHRKDVLRHTPTQVIPQF